MRFFTPLNNFWEWLKPEAAKYKLVVDCGCGDGDLIREMTQKKIRCLGIDLRYSLFEPEIPQDLCNQILPTEAEDSCLITMPMESLLLVCRPCHSGFPGLINEARDKSNPFYYIGFEDNLARDLHAPTNLILENVGEDGENLYQVC